MAATAEPNEPCAKPPSMGLLVFQLVCVTVFSCSLVSGHSGAHVLGTFFLALTTIRTLSTDGSKSPPLTAIQLLLIFIGSPALIWLAIKSKQWFGPGPDHFHPAVAVMVWLLCVWGLVWRWRTDRREAEEAAGRQKA